MQVNIDYIKMYVNSGIEEKTQLLKLDFTI